MVPAMMAAEPEVTAAPFGWIAAVVVVVFWLQRRLRLDAERVLRWLLVGLLLVVGARAAWGPIPPWSMQLRRNEPTDLVSICSKNNFVIVRTRYRFWYELAAVLPPGSTIRSALPLSADDPWEFPIIGNVELIPEPELVPVAVPPGAIPTAESLYFGYRPVGEGDAFYNEAYHERVAIFAGEDDDYVWVRTTNDELTVMLPRTRYREWLTR